MITTTKKTEAEITDEVLSRVAGWSVGLSVVMMIAGILAIIAPLVFGSAVAILVGWLLIFCGCAHVAYGWHSHGGEGFVWGILLGTIYTFAGAYILLNPLAGLSSLTLVLAVYLLFEALLDFVLSFWLRPALGSDWLRVHGAVTLILAFMIWWAWPESSWWAIGTVVGFSMLFSGFTRLMISLTVRRMERALS